MLDKVKMTHATGRENYGRDPWNLCVIFSGSCSPGFNVTDDIAKPNRDYIVDDFLTEKSIHPIN